MKITIFPSLLLLIATVAISYLAYDMANSNADSNDIVIGIGTGISVLLTLGCVLGISMEDGSINVNMKAWSTLAFIVAVIVNLCFAGFGVAMPYYVVLLTLMLVIHLWVVWKLSTIKDV